MDDVKPEVKVDLRFDAKPDVNAVKAELEEQERDIMRGWLTKRESDADVKEEVTDEGVKMEEGDERPLVKLEAGELSPQKELKVKPKGRTLIVMGTYSIGKERIVKGQWGVAGWGQR